MNNKEIEELKVDVEKIHATKRVVIKKFAEYKLTLYWHSARAILTSIIVYSAVWFTTNLVFAILAGVSYYIISGFIVCGYNAYRMGNYIDFQTNMAEDIIKQEEEKNA